MRTLLRAMFMRHVVIYLFIFILFYLFFLLIITWQSLNIVVFHWYLGFQFLSNNYIWKSWSGNQFRRVWPGPRAIGTAHSPGSQRGFSVACAPHITRRRLASAEWQSRDSLRRTPQHKPRWPVTRTGRARTYQREFDPNDHGFWSDHLKENQEQSDCVIPVSGARKRRTIVCLGPSAPTCVFDSCHEGLQNGQWWCQSCAFWIQRGRQIGSWRPQCCGRWWKG